jgi:hypothetical protein
MDTSRRGDGCAAREGPRVSPALRVSISDRESSSVGAEEDSNGLSEVLADDPADMSTDPN